jgi:hypothetical protein
VVVIVVVVVNADGIVNVRGFFLEPKQLSFTLPLPSTTTTTSTFTTTIF